MSRLSVVSDKANACQTRRRCGSVSVSIPPGQVSNVVTSIVPPWSQDPLIADATYTRYEPRTCTVYVARGVQSGLARQVALQLMAKDALGAHARDELGISETTTARPVQAAMASAATFTLAGATPLALVVISPVTLLLRVVAAGSLVFMALLGMIDAEAGGLGCSGPPFA